MRLRHNVPSIELRSDPVSASYQAEVDRSTNKAVLAYERAQRRLASAERRLDRANAKQQRTSNRRAAREVAIALELVELRREELKRIESLMKAAPASAEHRGVRGFRPIPTPGGTF
jgi:hypothetical protein